MFAGLGDGSDPRPRKHSARRRLACHSSSEESSGDDDAHSRRGAAAPAPPPAPMPDAYLKSPANDALAAAWCLRPWLPTVTIDMQAAVPARHFHTVFKGSGWSPAVRRTYDKMLKASRWP